MAEGNVVGDARVVLLRRVHASTRSSNLRCLQALANHINRSPVDATGLSGEASRARQRDAEGYLKPSRLHLHANYASKGFSREVLEHMEDLAFLKRSDRVKHTAVFLADGSTCLGCELTVPTNLSSV